MLKFFGIIFLFILLRTLIKHLTKNNQKKPTLYIEDNKKE